MIDRTKKQILLNTVRAGTMTMFAGTEIDPVKRGDDLVDALLDAGAVLWPADDQIVAFAASRVAQLRENGDASEVIDRVMLAGALDSLRTGDGNHFATPAELEAWTPSLVLVPEGYESFDAVVLATRRIYTCVRKSTLPVDGVNVLPTAFSSGGAVAGRWLTDACVADAASLRRYLTIDNSQPLPDASLIPLASLRSTGSRYRFDPNSVAVDDGVTVINNVVSGVPQGRWLRIWT